MSTDFPALDRKVRLHGRVCDQHRRGLPSVTVTVTAETGAQLGLARTDADGGFELAGLPGGPCVAIFSHAGYRPLATVVRSAAAPLDVTLDPAASVRGRVADRRSGHPVAAATITALGAGGEVLGTTMSGPDGRYALTGVDDVATLAVAAPGADPSATIVGSSPEPDREIDLELDVHSSLSGTVTAAGHPVAGLPLTLRGHDGRQVASTVTDGRGRYHFGRIPAGQYTVDQVTSLPQAKSVAAEAASVDLLLALPSREGPPVG